jgi:hypothetical protein
MELFLSLFIVLCFVGFLALMRGADAIYKFPGFMTFAFVVFILPQAIALVRIPGAAVPEAVASVLWMSTLCLVACFVGYRHLNFNFLGVLKSTRCHERHLILGAVIFTVIAVICQSMIGLMSDEERGGSMWSGKVTAYFFFSGGIYPAIAIFLRYALRESSVTGWLLFGVAMIQPVTNIIWGGRREVAAQAILTIGLVLFFERRLLPPRWLVPLAAVAALLIIPATGTYRSKAATFDWAGVQQMNLVDNFKSYMNEESILELRNAAIYIEATKSMDDYGWGAAYWDEMVWRFVPAQLLGNGFKDSLMIARGKMDYESQLLSIGYYVSVGSTLTGMADSFSQFGYFGAAVFAVMALWFKNVWESATQPDSIFAQLMYIGSVTSAMRAVTHQTVDFLPGMTYQLIFVLLLYFFSRIKGSTSLPAGR